MTTLGETRCPRCGTGLALGLTNLLLCPDCGLTYRMLKSGRLVRRPWIPDVDTLYGVLTFFGSDCTDEGCGNFTFGSITCDSCDSDAHTTPVYIVAGDSTARPPAHATEARRRPPRYRPDEAHVPTGDVALAVALINEYDEHPDGDALVCNAETDTLRNVVKILMAERAGAEPPWVHLA